jgi:prepilin signal peptidase PulO-like enzyme (type II secretory pathway)
VFASIALPSLATIGLYIVFKFAKSVESVGFKQRIPVSRLKVGDVLLESKVWDGISKRQLQKIKRSGKRFIWVKSGVRFAPAFPLALLFTLYFGDLILAAI